MKKVYAYDDLQPFFEDLLIEKESDELEYKSAAGGFPKSFWETYSSFANTNGGAIVFGVKERKGELTFDGLSKDQIEKYKKDFFNNMHSKQNVNIPLLSEKNVQEVEYEGNLFLLFYIPRVDRSLKPVYCGLDPYTGTYRRDIDGDYHCSREEVNSMFADANLSDPIDGRILKHYGKEDLDEATITQYRRKFEQSRPDHVWNTLTDDKFLEKINVLKKDRKTGEYGVTYAGLLMFGTYSALMDANPNFFPDYQEIQDKEDRWVNRICPDGNWESNLFQFYNRVLPILQNFLPKPFKLKNSQRIDETPAHVAVREALINALVHTDYTENATLNVYKYPNRIVFSNPGTMLISIDQFYKGGESVCRNKYLQTMFAFLGSAEKAGSGADKILRGWDEKNWKRPIISERVRPNKVELVMPMETWMDDSTKESLSRIFGPRLDTLNHPQLLTLALAYSEEEISNERLQYALSLHRSDITSMLRFLCEEKFLTSFGYGRGKTYSVYTTNNATLKGSKNAAPKSSKRATPKGSKRTAQTSVVSSSKPRKRYQKAELYKLITDFCVDWQTADDIALYIGRSKDYVRNFLLPQMTSMLEKMYEIPHHPKQKYRAIQNT